MFMPTNLSQPYHDVPLRVGLYVNATQVQRWQYKMVEDILKTGIAEVVVMVINTAPDETTRQKFLPLNRFLYNLYLWFDARIFRVRNSAFASVDLTRLLPDCPIIRVLPEMSGAADRFPEAALQQLRDLRLDVVVAPGFRTLKGEALTVARYGVWTYDDVDGTVNRGVLPGFREVVEADPVTGSVLQLLTEEPAGGKVLYCGYTTTYKYSVLRNNNMVCWKSAPFVARKLRDVYEEGPAALNNEVYRPYSYRPCPVPASLKMLQIMLRMTLRLLGSSLSRFFWHDQWALAYHIQPGRTTPADTFCNFAIIHPPPDRFWADPFVVKKDNKFYIFIEEYIYRTERGHIAVMEMDMLGNYTQPRPVLQMPYHLSYPFVFEWNGDYYMIPESGDNQTVDLYRCTSFPDKWEHVKTLMSDVCTVDTTLFEYNGKWWMFLVMGEWGWNELFVYYADSPLSDWQPVRRNPVLSDVRSARPAGRIFKFGDYYYRPSQDCAKRYGYAMVINRMCRLDETGYEEEIIAHIDPKWYPGLLGTHTLNHAEELTVIDGVFARRKF